MNNNRGCLHYKLYFGARVLLLSGVRLSSGILLSVLRCNAYLWNYATVWDSRIISVTNCTFIQS